MEESPAPLLSRIEKMKRDKIVPPMPHNPAPHITDRLIEIGLTQAAGMGAVPLSWLEINAWCERTAVDLEPWEARLIRRLPRRKPQGRRRNLPAPVARRGDRTRA